MRCFFRAMLWSSFLQVFVSAGSPTWEPIDEELDIMAFIDDEPEGISFIQKDARLAAGCGANCPEDDYDLVPPGDNVITFQLNEIKLPVYGGA
mmetsp:Transcript_3592/g.4166  ORF Transcript_3592/g.4166 Transcript_3592/m.4166 type:complete len:93 (-) Transcript_3592:71-349(-)